MNYAKQPRLTLVGAGPGDPELITLKAVNALKEADVVLYDALVNTSLLTYAKEGTEMVYVGKRAGMHSFSQERINQLIVEYAFSHGHVVRLKGGDPFVFGRGQEEIAHAEAYGVPSSVVPGISSALAVPASQKIPLTARGVNESFWVVTGTTKSGKLSKDLPLAAQSSATVVILMGTKKLKEITEVFRIYRDDDTPIAIIQNGTLENERIGLGTLDTIVEVAEELKLGAPAIILVGEVVHTHPDFAMTWENIQAQTGIGINGITSANS
ncbi:uroporphyrinogen-III C-methyltransferase [Rapidithrix thailandica]|uniref:uroporphyrinogen-III C-methyltransferase n=1 Tax=Rapidithrix thailandica TaxID=413964 RepID=A0AAW9S5T1_9BACT